MRSGAWSAVPPVVRNRRGVLKYRVPGNEADNLISRNRLAAARDVVIRLPTPSTTTRPLSLLRFCAYSFFAEVASARRHPALRHSLIKLRLQEVHHLIETDIPATIAASNSSTSLKL